MSRVSRALPLLCLAAAGCARVVGLDEYVSDADIAACAEAQVWADSSCTSVGVEVCGSGFEPDGHGGCVAILPVDRCLGQLARPGDRACVKPRCNPRPSPPPRADPVVYVRASAAEGGTGTLSNPFVRIADAIASVESAANPAIMVEAGEYRESLVVTRPLQFVAACDVRLSADADRPAFRIEGGGAMSFTQIEGFEIVGGSAGIEARDAFVFVSDTQLRDSAGPGLLADASGRSQITLQRVLIENARGAGVATYDAPLTIEDSTIRDTRTGAEGEDACGICVRGSGRVSIDPTLDARTSTVGLFTLTHSLLEDNAGAGVSVIGTRGQVKESVIRAAGEGQSTGLEVEERALGSLPGHLQVSHSLIEGMMLTGIRARNAYLQIDNSSVRDIRGAEDSGAARCLGNGVSVIWDRKAEAPERALELSSSSIERTRETGVLIQGARALIDGSVVRNSRRARCGDKLGDGIGVYAHEFAPAELDLLRTRIEGSDRASVAGFGGAAIEVLSSVALGAPIVSSDDPKVAGTSCAALNAARWAPCVVQDKTLPSALLGGGE